MNTEETASESGEEPIDLEKLPLKLVHGLSAIVEGKKAKEYLETLREKFKGDHKDWIYALYQALKEHPDRGDLFWALEKEVPSQE